MDILKSASQKVNMKKIVVVSMEEFNFKLFLMCFKSLLDIYLTYNANHLI